MPTKIKNIIARHTYLHNKVFDKEPKDRKKQDINALLNYEGMEVQFIPTSFKQGSLSKTE